MHWTALFSLFSGAFGLGVATIRAVGGDRVRWWEFALMLPAIASGLAFS